MDREGNRLSFNLNEQYGSYNTAFLCNSHKIWSNPISDLIHEQFDDLQRMFELQPHLMSFKMLPGARYTTVYCAGNNMWPVGSSTHPYSRGSILGGSVLIAVFQMRTWR